MTTEVTITPDSKVEVKMSDGPWIIAEEAEADENGTDVWVRLWFGWKVFRNAGDSGNIRIS